MKPELPRYQCHKVVHAAKIEALHPVATSPGAMPSAWILWLTLPDAPTVGVTVQGAWYGKHQPCIGGYYVQYDGGYASYSPADVFEDGYTRLPEGT